MQITSEKLIHTDVLIIGGGTAGCYAALTLRSLSDASVVIAEKADIRRSGCLAAGVNALNAYITKGHTPQFYVDYAKKDAAGIVREDLLLTMSEGLNEVTKKLEDLGLVILKDEQGEYVARGTRNIKINGENIKTILADAVKKLDDVQVINHLNITDYIVRDNTIAGALCDWRRCRPVSAQQSRLFPAQDVVLSFQYRCRLRHGHPGRRRNDDF